jgi:hypothetical protein
MLWLQVMADGRIQDDESGRQKDCKLLPEIALQYITVMPCKSCSPVVLADGCITTAEDIYTPMRWFQDAMSSKWHINSWREELQTSRLLHPSSSAEAALCCDRSA